MIVWGSFLSSTGLDLLAVILAVNRGHVAEFGGSDDETAGNLLLLLPRSLLH